MDTTGAGPSTAHTSTTSININDLPDELIHMLFSHFTPQQLCSQLAHVCTKWHRFSRKPELWRELEIEQTMSDAVAVKLFRSAPLKKLEYLDISERSISADSLILLISTHCPSLREVLISSSSENRSCSSSSVELFASSCPNLDIVQLLLPLSDRKYNVFNAFLKLKRLNVCIDLRSEADITTFDVRRKLEILSCQLNGDRQLCEQFFRSFLEIPKRELGLLYLHYDAGIVSEHAYKNVLSSIEHVTNLCHIVIAGAGTQAGRECAIHRMMDEMSTYQLSAFFRTDDTYLKVSEQSVVVFRNCAKVTNSVVVLIANSCPRLTLLDLTQCVRVTDRGICRVVAKCRALKTLRLDGLKITAACLWAIPVALTNLEELSLRGCAINAETLAELAAACPNLTIIRQ